MAVTAPVPKVTLLFASLPSKFVYATTPSPSISSDPTSASGPGTPAVGVADDLIRRVADAQSKLGIKDNPYMVCYFFPILHFPPSS